MSFFDVLIHIKKMTKKRIARSARSESWKWIDVFRASALTMPWAEGYTFAFDGPLLGTPQMVELRQEMLRSGVSRVTEGLAPGRLDGQILFYVTNQWPGQSPNAWKRQFYAALAHHVKGEC